MRVLAIETKTLLVFAATSEARAVYDVSWCTVQKYLKPMVHTVHSVIYFCIAETATQHKNS